MTHASIPVDLSNPGQVFACMGFLEAADVLLGNAEGGFNWTTDRPRFEICADGNENPFRVVLEFLKDAKLERLAPKGYKDPSPQEKKGAKKKGKKSGKPKEAEPTTEDDANDLSDNVPLRTIETFPAPAKKVDSKVLPLRLVYNDCRIDLTLWCDASSRNSFKLFAGQQKSVDIARQMLNAIRELWIKNNKENISKENITQDPLNVTAPLGGSSFKLDPRKGWTALDAGYSPDEQGHDVEASPIVELMAAIGLEHARPDEFDTREIRYGVWQGLLPPVLARPALGGVQVGVPMRFFRFTLALAGKNKNVTFAQEEAER